MAKQKSSAAEVFCVSLIATALSVWLTMLFIGILSETLTWLPALSYWQVFLARGIVLGLTLPTVPTQVKVVEY